MSITLNSSPYRTVGGTTCKWNGAHQPNTFKVLRRDFNVSSFVDLGGNVMSVGVSDTSELTDGDMVFVQINSTTLGAGGYNNNYVITVIDATHFSIPCNFYGDISSVAYANYTTARKNYFILTKLYKEDVLTVIGTSKNKNNTVGLITINVESFLKPNLAFDNRFRYNVINWQDISLGNTYYIEFLEYYSGSAGDRIDPTKWYYANAVKQIQEKWGVNLLDYYPNLDIPTPAPKFMNDFVRPTWFYGMPFDLTFIKWNDDDTVWNRFVEFLDTNRQPTGAATDALNSGQLVHRLLMPDKYSGASFMRVSITTEDLEALTEIKEVKVDYSCQQNPVYLCWLGKKGGLNYWCFHKTQTIAKSVSNATEFIPNVEDIETAIGYAEFYAKDSIPQMILGATLLKEDIEGIATMLDSVSVLMQTNIDTWVDDGAPKWMRVKVQPGSFKLYETENNYTTIEVMIDLPQLYNQMQ